MAGECGYRSMLVAIGVAQGADPELRSDQLRSTLRGRLSGRPVGVKRGPGDAAVPSASADGLKKHQGSQNSAAPGHPGPGSSRRSRTFVTTGKIIEPPGDFSDLLAARAGCFVSIKTRNGDLRGCIGTIDPVKDSLAEEIIWNAINAATATRRFSPVRADELPDLKYSVDVLSRLSHARQKISIQRFTE